MNYDVSDLQEIWRKGDREMPPKLKHVVDAAGEELLLRSLHLPSGAIDTIKYNAGKSSQSVNEYISTVLLGHLNTV